MMALITGWITYRQFIRDNGGVTTVTYDGTMLRATVADRSSYAWMPRAEFPTFP